MTIDFDRRLQHAVAIAALAVLVFSSLVGLWLATLLIWPDLGGVIAPMSYGRWIPLHLDLQLFGWCSLPVVGLLLRRMLPPIPRANLHARNALAAWVGALAAGGISWLGGGASGKIFLNWSGFAGIAFGLAQLFLWSTLVAGWRERRRQKIDAPLRSAGDALLLALLFFVPFALHFSTQASVYPPINPDSGGATGHSLLASSLGIVSIGLLLPFLLGRSPRDPSKQPAAVVGAAWVVNWLVYSWIGHGDASHHAPDQIAGLATLLIWPPVLVWWFRRFAWERSHRVWLLGAAAWAGFLVVDGMVLFLPGALEAAKFTNALVAHSHLAMAGLLTSLNMLMLISLAPRSRLATALAARGPWLAWNIATLSMVVALTILGFLEARWAADGTSAPGIVQNVYMLRWIMGAAMIGPAAYWLVSAVLAREARDRPQTGSTPANHPHTREELKHAGVA